MERPAEAGDGSRRSEAAAEAFAKKSEREIAFWEEVGGTSREDEVANRANINRSFWRRKEIGRKDECVARVRENREL